MNQVIDTNIGLLNKDIKYLSKYLKPNLKMKCKKIILNKINPYSQFRLNNNISSTNVYLLKCLNKLFNKKYISSLK